MARRPPRATRTDPPCPYTTLFRAAHRARDRLGKHTQRARGGTVVALAHHAGPPGAGGEVDDATGAPLQHRAVENLARAQHRRHAIDLVGIEEVIDGMLPDILVDTGTGHVVHHHVDLAPAAHRRSDPGRDLGLAGPAVQHRAARTADLGFGVLA